MGHPVCIRLTNFLQYAQVVQKCLVCQVLQSTYVTNKLCELANPNTIYRNFAKMS